MREVLEEPGRRKENFSLPSSPDPFALSAIVSLPPPSPSPSNACHAGYPKKETGYLIKTLETRVTYELFFFTMIFSFHLELSYPTLRGTFPDGLPA